MPKRKTNFIIFFEKREEWHNELRGYDNSMNAGNMFINRCCIDEEASFEISGIYHLKDSSPMMRYNDSWVHSRESLEQRRRLGKDFRFSLELLFTPENAFNF